MGLQLGVTGVGYFQSFCSSCCSGAGYFSYAIGWLDLTELFLEATRLFTSMACHFVETPLMLLALLDTELYS